MTEENQEHPMNFKSGDVYQGFQLGEDNEWHPVTTASPQGMSLGTKLVLSGFAVLVVIVLAGLTGYFLSTADDISQPAATETSAVEETPTPVETVTETPDPVEEDDPREDEDYYTTTFLMEKALKQSGADRQAVCLAYALQEDKTISRFTNVAVRQGMSYEPAKYAVEDFFEGMCSR